MSGIWNSQASAWGNSGNTPGDQPVGSDREITSPFWDVWLDSSPDPSNQHFSPWDIVSIAGRQLPGICKVDSRRGRRIDVKKSKGVHYATLTFNGYDPAKIAVTVSIWTQAQLDVLDGFMSLLESPPSSYVDKTVLGGFVFSALDIKHPALRLQGISQVLIEQIDTLRPSSVKGVWEMKIHAIEYKVVKIKSATSSVKGSTDLTVPAVITGTGPLITPGADTGFLAPPSR